MVRIQSTTAMTECQMSVKKPILLFFAIVFMAEFYLFRLESTSSCFRPI